MPSGGHACPQQPTWTSNAPCSRTAGAAAEMERGLIRRCRNYTRHERAKKSASLLSLHLLSAVQRKSQWRDRQNMPPTSDTFVRSSAPESFRESLSLSLSLSPSDKFARVSSSHTFLDVSIRYRSLLRIYQRKIISYPSSVVV